MKHARLAVEAEPPKEPGWYWVKNERTSPHVVPIYASHDDFTYCITRNNENQWAGPIPEPEE